MTLTRQLCACANISLILWQLLEPQCGSRQALACSSSFMVRCSCAARSRRSSSVMRWRVSSIFRALGCAHQDIQRKGEHLFFQVYCQKQRLAVALLKSAFRGPCCRLQDVQCCNAHAEQVHSKTRQRLKDRPGGCIMRFRLCYAPRGGAGA